MKTVSQLDVGVIHMRPLRKWPRMEPTPHVEPTRRTWMARGCCRNFQLRVWLNPDFEVFVLSRLSSVCLSLSPPSGHHAATTCSAAGVAAGVAGPVLGGAASRRSF
ncbi:hypothetical protein NL676_008512 [Syzygium grande]|nr:hypothetical protein NL676_008512 [Syzygium grande]